MEKNELLNLLNKYDFRLIAVNKVGKDGYLYLKYDDIEICEVLKTEFEKIYNLKFDDYTLQFVIFNLLSITESDINIQVLMNRNLYNNFFSFQNELKERNEIQLNGAKIKDESKTVVVSKFSNITLFLLLGIIALMWAMFEIRLQNKDDEIQKSIFDLQNKIIAMQETVKENSKIAPKKEQNIQIATPKIQSQSQPLFNIEQVGNKKEITAFVEQRSSEFGIDPKIVKTIINIESNNKPFALGIVSNNAQSIVSALSGNKNIVISNNPNSKFVSLVPNNEQAAKELFDMILMYKDEWGIISIDYGLMQINHDTIVSYELEPKEIYLNPYYNIALGIDILKSCYNLFPKDQFNTIECYNKGVDKKKLNNSNDYYNKFINEYKRINL